MITNDKGIVELKHFVLREVCRLAWEDRLLPEETEKLVYEISPGPKGRPGPRPHPLRCCGRDQRSGIRDQGTRETDCHGPPGLAMTGEQTAECRPYRRSRSWTVSSSNETSPPAGALIY